MRRLTKSSARRSDRVRAFVIARPPAPIKPAFVLRFVAWAERAPEHERAEAASALARACPHVNLTHDQREGVLTAMTTLLDDSSPVVRRALAEVLSGSAGAPRALVVALANDEAGVAEPLLLRSPLLNDAELAERALLGEPTA